MELAEYRRMAEVEDVHWWYRSTRALLRQLLEPSLPPGGRFLDVGCGTGATGGWLGERGDLVAVDFEPQALTLFGERHSSIGVIAADAGGLPLASDSFDAVLCVTVLCHRSIPDPSAVVRELARVVRPGGVLCLWEPGVERLHRAHDRVTHTARRFSRRGLAGHIAAAGMTLERSTGAYSFLIPAAAVKTLVERGEVASDLDHHAGGLRGVLGGLASAERRLLRRADLPFGLSVVAVGRKPG
ncbi:MAG: class I SAM-dependent methyltransferase [Ilumatobacteraceae bacterium]